MKKWINTLFFGSCFIAAVLIEIYALIIWEGNYFSTVSLGVVVLITGYLFMDSIRSRLFRLGTDAKFFMDRIMDEETERWMESHMELMNLQKAAYTATKKNAELITGQFAELLTRLETLEHNNAAMLQKMLELQKKSLEGQKNALNLELNYNNENTKKILEALKAGDKEAEAGIIGNNGREDALDSEIKVTPIYENPNTNLTSDEIASLFASFGQ